MQEKHESSNKVIKKEWVSLVGNAFEGDYK